MRTVPGPVRGRPHPTRPRRVAALLALCLLGLAPFGAPRPDAGPATLAGRLGALADEHGFRLQGLEKVGDQTAVDAGGDLVTRLQTLLRDFNHVVERAPDRVTRVIILGPKIPSTPGYSLPTSRRGAHQTVQATVYGAPGHRTNATLLVDTGASSVILPASLLPGLGYRAEELPDLETQTVNGRLTGKLARLERLSVGAASATGVDALFVPDDRLGDTGLLGMSFLGRFRVTLDDAGERLLLSPR